MPNQFVFDGRLAADVEFTSANTNVAKFRLIRTEYAGKDADGNAKQRVVTAQFTAFDSLAQFLSRVTNKGDQLIVTARFQDESWSGEDGAKRYGHSFIAEAVDRGAPGPATREVIAKHVAGRGATDDMRDKESVSIEDLEDYAF